MHIGGLKPCNNVFLAPMAGVTDLPMRELAVELGAGLAVGEMQSADLSLARSRKTTQRQRHSARAGLRSVQIVGYDPRQLADAARFNADLGADIIDINMGCPAKKVCRRAAGSALLADEALVGRILEAVVNAVDVPVTVKIRTGTDPDHRNGVTIARIAENAGIQMLTVHGRTRADRFKGQAEYLTIAEIVRAGILSVAKGQTEAASALGLRRQSVLKLVVVPQAMRVIIPPLTNQYLNLTKNSSLAVFIGYPDLVQVFAGTVLNQTGAAVQIIAITMAVYLVISLVTSFAMNIYNRRVALVER